MDILLRGSLESLSLGRITPEILRPAESSGRARDVLCSRDN